MIRLWITLGILLLIFAGCSHLDATRPPRPDQLQFPPLEFTFPEVIKQQLGNGMRLYLKEDHELPLVEMTLQIGGGTIDELPGKTGLTQLFAATLETGGAGDLKPAEFEAELEALAIDLSVASSTYGFVVDLSLQRQDLERGLELLTALLRRPGFDAERMELARKNLLESIRRKNDDPETIAARILATTIYQDHPFGRYPKIDEVNGFTRSDLLQLHQRYFRPDNIWLAVSGAVDQNEMVRLLEKNFGDWTVEPTPQQQLPSLPKPPPGQILVVDKDIPQSNIMMGHPGISKDNPDQFALRVANFILGGGGFNSRMMREVRSNRGLAYSVYSYFQIGRQLPELFIAGSETKTASTVEVVTLMRQLIQQMIDEPVTVAELELAKQSLINSFVFAFNDTHSVVTRKVRLDFFHYPENYLEDYQKKIAAVSIDDVQRVARQYLHPDRLQIVLVGDSKVFLETLGQLDLPVKMVDPNNGEQTAVTGD